MRIEHFEEIDGSQNNERAVIEPDGIEDPNAPIQMFFMTQIAGETPGAAKGPAGGPALTFRTGCHRTPAVGPLSTARCVHH